MKKIAIIIGLAVLTGMFSCKKVLDIEPTSSFSTNTVWSSPALVQVFVNQIYAEAVFGFKDAGFGWGSQTDELLSNFNWCNENQYVQGQATPDNQNSSFPLNYSSTINFWSTLYNTIQKTNTFFASIGQLDTLGNGAAIKSMTAQVHFLRALCYFELLKRFGGVPLITKVYTANDTKFSNPRASWDDTEAFILADIAAALPGLQAAAPSGQEGVATTGAALALKARLLLYAASPRFNTANDQAKWQAAADAALAVINMSQYSLYGTSTTYGKIFTDFFNPEVIFARVYGNVFLDRYNTVYRDLSPNGYNGYSAYNVLGQMVDAFQMKDGSAFSWNNPSQASNPYANRDPRLYADVLTNNASFQGRPAQFWLGGLDSKLSSLSPWNASKTGYTVLKMVDSTYNFNVQPYSPAQWIVFRLSEMYLNYAEAEAQLGQTATALTYLNKIRQRAGMPDIVSGGGADLIGKIMQERRIELCFEGHRFFDLRRWNIADRGRGRRTGHHHHPDKSAPEYDVHLSGRYGPEKGMAAELLQLSDPEVRDTGRSQPDPKPGV
ncbi:RagB/SusD family nutrient uptake outer membrane protein [Puia sp. P3]|uniref:RagB/SusD family nutrient uptake outer membrane protein n=1 Tax=Puia sp. P3 TaxID=3423952 RepID=UPI003D66928F